MSFVGKSVVVVTLSSGDVFRVDPQIEDSDETRIRTYEWAGRNFLWGEEEDTVNLAGFGDKRLFVRKTHVASVLIEGNDDPERADLWMLTY